MPGRGGRGGGGGGGNRGPLPRSVQISKKLSRLLRHAAEEEGIQLDSAGYANVAEVLNNRLLRSFKVSFDELRELVRDNDKQRYSMITASSLAATTRSDTDEAQVGDDKGKTNGQPALESQDPKDWLIRANQGHSLKIDSEGLLTPITAGKNAPETAVHGTTHAAWPQIVATGGLKPMTRTHVHFASGLPAGFKSITMTADGEAADDAAAPPVISGMRNSSTVLMFLDVGRALASGLKLWVSENGVVLSEGDAQGLVPLELFERVEDRTGQGVLLQAGKVVKDAPASWAGKGKG